MSSGGVADAERYNKARAYTWRSLPSPAEAPRSGGTLPIKVYR